MQKIVRWHYWRRHAVQSAPTHQIQSSLQIWKKVEKIFKNRTVEINHHRAASHHCQIAQVNHIPSLVLNRMNHRSEIDRPQHQKIIDLNRHRIIIALKHQNRYIWHKCNRMADVIQTKVLHRHALRRPLVHVNHRFSNSIQSIWKKVLVQVHQIIVPRLHLKKRPAHHRVRHRKARCTVHQNYLKQPKNHRYRIQKSVRH